MGSFAKDRFQQLLNRISTKTLKQPTVFTQLYIDLQLKTQGLDSEIRIKYTFILTSGNVATMVTNKSKRFFLHSYTLCLCRMHQFVSHLIYLTLTKTTMQQCFHPSAKHSLYRYITPSFVRHSFRVKGETWYFFANSLLCILI